MLIVHGSTIARAVTVARSVAANHAHHALAVPAAMAHAARAVPGLDADSDGVGCEPY